MSTHCVQNCSKLYNRYSGSSFHGLFQLDCQTRAILISETVLVSRALYW